MTAAGDLMTLFCSTVSPKTLDILG